MAGFPGYFITGGFPQKSQVFSFTHSLIDYLFPVAADEALFLRHHQDSQLALKNQLAELLSASVIRKETDPDQTAAIFFNSLAPVKDMLLKDAALIMEFDPAAYSLEEVILCYPGFFAIMCHRIAHILYRLKIPVLPRMISEWSHSKTGIDIHAGAQIGCPFFIDHGTGVVIGETSIIGNDVKIYQGVTLGAIAVRKEDASRKRHPTIENNVVIYAGSTILGGDTIIGHDSIIGGNTWITESVKPYSVVYHKNQLIVSDRNLNDEPINFVI